MKKIILSFFILGMVLSFGCAAKWADPQTVPTNTEYAYTDDYASVDWTNMSNDAQYSYYDDDQLFLVCYNNGVFIIPYDYFINNIFNICPWRFHWCSYDYFGAWWGIDSYNGIWNNYYYRHHRAYQNGNRNWFGYHKRFNGNRDFRVRRNELRNPQFRNQPHQYQSAPRSYTPRSYTPRSYTPRSYTPRSFGGGGGYHAAPRSFGGGGGGYHATPRSGDSGGHGGARKKD